MGDEEKKRLEFLKSRADKAESSYKEAVEIDKAFRKTHRTMIREFRKNQSAVFKSRSALYATRRDCLTMFPVTRIITHTNQPRRTTSRILRRSERISNLGD